MPAWAISISHGPFWASLCARSNPHACATSHLLASNARAEICGGPCSVWPQPTRQFHAHVRASDCNAPSPVKGGGDVNLSGAAQQTHTNTQNVQYTIQKQ